MPRGKLERCSIPSITRPTNAMLRSRWRGAWPITTIRIGTEVPALPAYEFLSTESETFAEYAYARANRRDAFFITPAGGADICNIPVPVRRAK